MQCLGLKLSSFVTICFLRLIVSNYYYDFIIQSLAICPKGQLVAEVIPVCPGESARYRCTYNVGTLTWNFYTTPTAEIVSFHHLVTPSGYTEMREIAGSSTVFDVTSANSSFLSITASISDPVRLNGIRMTCLNGESLINIEFGESILILQNVIWGGGGFGGRREILASPPLLYILSY